MVPRGDRCWRMISDETDHHVRNIGSSRDHRMSRQFFQIAPLKGSDHRFRTRLERIRVRLIFFKLHLTI
jgi:hypothetical protein